MSSNVIAFRRKATTGTAQLRGSAQACEAQARDLFAAERADAALELLSRAVVWHPRSRELRYLYAVGLLNAGQLDTAAGIARRLVYLGRRSVAAHMLVGTIAQSRGDRAGALRAFRNGLSCCAGADEDAVVPLTGTARYGHVSAALAADIAHLLAS